MERPTALLLFLISLLFFSCDCGNELSADQRNLDKNIFLVASSTRRWTGLAVSNTSRLFVNYPNWSTDHTFSVAEVSSDSQAIPFPNEEWNTWKEGLNPSEHFIAVQSVFIDRDNFLWVVDAGNIQREGEYLGIVPGGAKLVKIDLSANAVVQTIVFRSPVIEAESYLNDVRIDESKQMAYLTDSNKGAIIVVDLRTGSARKTLDNSASTKSDGKILTIEGMPYTNPKGEHPTVHSDGIALNKDHTELYWRALTGEGLYKIPTELLNNALLSDNELNSKVINLGNFPPSDGMMFGFYNDLYLTSIEENAIRSYDGGNYTRLVRQRNDLKWPDSFSIGPDGYLYFTTSQVHLSNPTDPYKIFKIQIRF